MTDKELDCEVSMVPARIQRCARGSGTQNRDLEQLLEQYKVMSKTVGKMGKMGLAGKAGYMSQMMRNPKAMMSKMSSMMDPRMLKQMGGASGMMNMVKQPELMKRISKGIWA